jgi:hypothetical protein
MPESRFADFIRLCQPKGATVMRTTPSMGMALTSICCQSPSVPSCTRIGCFDEMQTLVSMHSIRQSTTTAVIWEPAHRWWPTTQRDMLDSAGWIAADPFNTCETALICLAGTAGPQDDQGTSAGERWGGVPDADDTESFALRAAALYGDASAWRECQLAGFRLLRALFDSEQTLGAVEVHAQIGMGRSSALGRVKTAHLALLCVGGSSIRFVGQSSL